MTFPARALLDIMPRASLDILARVSLASLSPLFAAIAHATEPPDRGATPEVVREFVEDRCLGCHDSFTAEGGLDLESLSLELDRQERSERWVLIHDRIRDGEMPPPENGEPRPVAAVGWSSRPGDSFEGGGESSEDHRESSEGEMEGDDASREVLRALGTRLAEADRRRVASQGRASARRMNRSEYENRLRQQLEAPWLQVARLLPEDGVDHLFNKVGARLDVSHVQMERYLDVATASLRLAVNAAAHPSKTTRYYAREEPVMHGYVHYRFGQTAATRAIVPLDGWEPELGVIRKEQPMTVGESDPEKREREAMGVFSGTYSATTKYDFTRLQTPIDGRYRLRFKTYTFMAGPNGASGGNDHGLSGGKRAWWRPDRTVICRGERSEPVTLYALSGGGDSRWLATFDSTPEPSVFETVVTLRRGEGIRPDAARLVRTRPGWSGNPNATEEGVPGFAMNWLEVEGPLHETWPPASYRAVFGDLPFEVEDGSVRIATEANETAIRQQIRAFARRGVGVGEATEEVTEAAVELYDHARELGFDTTEAAISAMASVLCGPEFLYFDYPRGPLSAADLKERLAYFLWNGPADPDPDDARLTDEELAASELAEGGEAEGDPIGDLVEAMLADRRSDRFVDAFLDYWLDLRDLNANTPDSELYPDYYLDELLTESSLLETRRFFRELIEKNLPAVNLVDADFAFVNERLAALYGLEPFEGVSLRRVELPETSLRGGLLTQSSVLRVTANGTTTSPVIRGAWITERILGVEIPPPPSGVDAVEPDTRGATTIREQLDRHREVESCNACHEKFDPAGFALENFDVVGGWRDRYRAIGGEGDAAIDQRAVSSTSHRVARGRCFAGVADPRRDDARLTASRACGGGVPGDERGRTRLGPETDARGLQQPRSASGRVFPVGGGRGVRAFALSPRAGRCSWRLHRFQRRVASGGRRVALVGRFVLDRGPAPGQRRFPQHGFAGPICRGQDRRPDAVSVDDAWGEREAGTAEPVVDRRWRVDPVRGFGRSGLSTAVFAGDKGGDGRPVAAACARGKHHGPARRSGTWASATTWRLGPRPDGSVHDGRPRRRTADGRIA